jgi:putative protease
MAKAKKKAKSKVKRKKVVARKKPVRKIVKKVVRAVKKVLKRPAPKPAKAAPPPPPPPPPPGERVGVVTHYYAHVSVAVVKLDPGTTLRVGDNIHVRGHTSDFGQRVESLQIGHAQVDEVGPSDDFGLKVNDHAREHDVVYRVKPG